MEKIIKQILNYEELPETARNKEKFIANFTALCLYLLQKNGNLTDENSANIDLDDTKDNYSYCMGKINLYEKILDESEDYIFGLYTIAHEICHLAQDANRNLSYKFKKKTLVYQPEDYDAILYYKYIQRENMFNVYDSYDFEDMLEKIKDDKDLALPYTYLSSFYYLQPHEIEANNFADYALSEIIRIAKTITLNKTENLKLKKFESEVNQYLKNEKEGFEYSVMIRFSPHAKHIVNKIVFEVQNSILNDEDDILERIRKDDIEETYVDAYVLGKTLELVYDEKIAHAILKEMTGSPEHIEDYYKIIMQLVFRTKIQLTEEEIEKVLKTIEYYNKENDLNLTFEDCMSERERILHELDEIEKSTVESYLNRNVSQFSN